MKSGVKSINYILYSKFKHISRFSIVGAANTLIDFLVFTTLHGLFGFNYIFSQVLGYSFGVTNSFIFNKKWTFEDRNSSKKGIYELLQFIVVNLISLIITIAAMKFLVTNLNLNVYVSKVVVTFIAQVTNFCAYKLWVFN